MKPLYRIFAVVCFSLTTNLLQAKVDEVERIALVGAFQGELDAIMKFMDPHKIDQEVVINGMPFYLGTAHGKDVVFFKTNTSTINAAMTTQLALSNFNIKKLLFAGIAGGINPELEKGDISIPQRWYHHAQGAYYNKKSEEEGYVLREGSESRHPFGNFGMFFPSGVSAIRDEKQTNIKKPFFEADPELLAVARETTEFLQEDDKRSLKNGLGTPAKIKVHGAGVAGPVFMDNSDYRDFVFTAFSADCLDMESSAIAHVCWANHVPFLIIRSLSDLAGGQEGENEIAEFADQAKHNAAKVLNAIVEAL